MRSLITRTIILAIVCGVCAQNAAASSAPWQASYAGQRPMPSRLASSLEEVAEAYWGARSVQLPLPVTALIAPEASLEAGGRGEMPGAQVWLAEEQVNDALHLAGWENRWAARVTLCFDYLHERGHNAGLGHDVGAWASVMGGTTGVAPPKCEKWAYRLRGR